MTKPIDILLEDLSTLHSWVEEEGESCEGCQFNAVSYDMDCEVGVAGGMSQQRIYTRACATQEPFSCPGVQDALGKVWAQYIDYLEGK